MEPKMSAYVIAAPDALAAASADLTGLGEAIRATAVSTRASGMRAARTQEASTRAPVALASFT